MFNKMLKKYEEEKVEREEKVRRVTVLMEKALKEHIERTQYSYYVESYALETGKVEGMKEALRILKEVME